MKILIDIGHPAHVHLFKNFAKLMIGKGHSVLFTCRDKEFIIFLLNKYNFHFKCLGKHYRTNVLKVFGLLEFILKILYISFKFKPNFFLSHGSMYAAFCGWILKKPHISFEDTFNFEQIKLYKPFTKVILTSTYFHPYLGKNNIKYPGYHELAYLHPNYFQPNRSILSELGISGNKPFFILRFVSWNATHDIGHQGISDSTKIILTKKLSNFGRVFISSEKQLSKELEPYRLSIDPDKIHDAIAFSSLLYGESATMAAEAAVLGVPAIYLDDNGRLYTNELEEKYGLVFNYSESKEDQELSIEKALELIKINDVKEEWKLKKDRMIADKIDVTAFLVWFIEKFPNSCHTLKKEPDIFKKFK
ncbi:MAG: DUF354 domain-containing protein [Bacteroidales bacterium]|nr:DUF354 domain-containing protein [Bacteroidales bacterium]